MADKGIVNVTTTITNVSDVTKITKTLAVYTDAAVDEYVVGKVMTAPTAAPANIDLDTLAGTFVCLVIQNLDPVNAVTLTWDDSGANSNTQEIPPGAPIVLPDVDPATDPTVQCAVADGLIEVAYFGT